MVGRAGSGERRPRGVHHLGEGSPVFAVPREQLDAGLVDVVEHERDLERVARAEPTVERGLCHVKRYDGTRGLPSVLRFRQPHGREPERLVGRDRHRDLARGLSASGRAAIRAPETRRDRRRRRAS